MKVLAYCCLITLFQAACTNGSADNTPYSQSTCNTETAGNSSSECNQRDLELDDYSLDETEQAAIHWFTPSRSGGRIANVSVLGNHGKAGIRLENVSDVIIENVIIDGAKDGIFLRNVRNITIKNSVIRHAEFGIRLSISGSSDNVVIEGNFLEDISKDGVLAPQRSEFNVDQRNLIINNNILRKVATDTISNPGKHHGLYVQASDSIIENNQISNVMDGNGISVRSSAILRNNRITGTGKSGIRYFADHKRGTNNLLLIENNQICQVAENFRGSKAIELLDAGQEFHAKPDWVVENFVIQGNALPDAQELALVDKTLFKNVQLAQNESRPSCNSVISER